MPISSSSVEVVTALRPHVARSGLQIVLAAEAVPPLREEDHSLVVLAVIVVDQHALLPVGDLQRLQRLWFNRFGGYKSVTGYKILTGYVTGLRIFNRFCIFDH